MQDNLSSTTFAPLDRWAASCLLCLHLRICLQADFQLLAPVCQRSAECSLQSAACSEQCVRSAADWLRRVARAAATLTWSGCTGGCMRVRVFSWARFFLSFLEAKTRQTPSLWSR